MPIEQNLYNESAFEKIRDAVAAILITELNNQLTIYTTEGDTQAIEFLNTYYKKDKYGISQLNLFKERFYRWNITELNNINLFWDSIGLSKGSQARDQKGDSRLYIQVNTRGIASDLEKGDVTASLNMQKMLGILRSIIMHTSYIRLGFEAGFINRRWVENLDNFRPQENESKVNADFVISGAVSLSVEHDEKNLGVSGNQLLESHTLITADNGQYTLLDDTLITP